MEKMWMRSVITLALCLSVAACGKSKDGSSVSTDVKAPSKPTPDKAIDMKGNGANKTVDRSKPHGAQEKGAGNKGSADQGAGGSTTPANPKPDGNTNANTNGNSSTNTNVNSKTIPNPDAGSNSNKPVNPPPKGDTSANTTDALSTESDSFSAAAEDGLRTYLTFKQKQISGTQRAHNVKLSQSIQKAQMTFSSPIDIFRINLTINGKEVGFVAKKSDGKKMDMPSNAHGFSGTLTCMDQLSDRGQTCETSVAEINYGDATAQIIFRQTEVALSADFGNHNCLTQECEDLYNLFRFTEQKVTDVNTMKSAVMESSEIIMGRTDFTLKILTNDNQILKISGPLKNPLLQPTTDIAADISLTADDLKDPATGQIRKVRLNQALNDVRIVTNDGRGRIGLLVKMRIQDDGRGDIFRLGIERKVRPISTPVEPLRAASN